MSQFPELAPHYDELMHSVPYDAWAEYVELLWSIVGHKPRRVLDCACGTGNLTFEFARQGFYVAGVDLSAPMIEIARKKAEDECLPIRFEVADLGDFQLGETFDSATCLYDSLNYILDPAHLKRAFAAIAAHVEPNGVFVFDMNSDYALRSDLFSQTNRHTKRSLHYDWRASFDENTRICSVRMKFEQTRANGEVEVFHETHRERAYELPEVEAMLDETGWELESSFDAYTLNRVHGKSERWFLVVRRR
jgi:SAM-dependent methyltransferase